MQANARPTSQFDEHIGGLLNVKLVLFLFALVAVTLQAQVVTRTSAAPEIEVTYHGLLDTLATVIGAWPEHSVRISVGMSALKRGSTSMSRVLLDPSWNRRVLLHEFGHFWSMVHSSRAMELADSLHVDPFRRNGEERLANAFADAMEVYAGNRQASPRDSLTLRFILNAESR